MKNHENVKHSANISNYGKLHPYHGKQSKTNNSLIFGKPFSTQSLKVILTQNWTRLSAPWRLTR